MRNKVLQWCRQQHLLSPGDSVVCAVSGGADSTAMLHCLLQLRDDLGITVSAAHYNHRLRGAESDADETFVRELCRDWDVPLTVSGGDVAARAERTGESIEEAARNMRYDFFASLPGLVATAHTADDNLETLLLNLLRGTSLRGLCGIPARRDAFIRPLLSITREEIEAYLSAQGIPHREDSSNKENDYLRNRLRHNVVPLLREENPSVSEAALRCSLLLREDEAYLEQEAQRVLTQAVRPGGWSCSALSCAPGAIRTRAIRALLQPIHAPKLSACHVEAVDQLVLTGSASGRCDLPGGWIAGRQYDLLTLSRAAVPASLPRTVLQAGSTTELPEYGLCIRCEETESVKKVQNDPCAFAVLSPVQGELIVRCRQEGDSICLPGGRKTLKKLFIDRKIPAALRGLVPVFSDDQGILAVGGIVADCKRLARPGDRAIVITIEEKEERHHDEQI